MDISVSERICGVAEQIRDLPSDNEVVTQKLQKLADELFCLATSVIFLQDQVKDFPWFLSVPMYRPDH